MSTHNRNSKNDRLATLKPKQERYTRTILVSILYDTRAHINKISPEKGYTLPSLRSLSLRDTSDVTRTLPTQVWIVKKEKAERTMVKKIRYRDSRYLSLSKLSIIKTMKQMKAGTCAKWNRTIVTEKKSCTSPTFWWFPSSCTCLKVKWPIPSGRRFRE